MTTPAPDEELDDILLKHRTDTISISEGKSNGLDIGTSAKEAKSQILAYVDKRERLARQEGVERGAEIANEEWLKFADFVQKGISALTNSKITEGE